MARKYQISLEPAIETAKGMVGPGAIDSSNFPYLDVVVAIAERLEALVEGVDKLVLILDTRMGQVGQL